MKKVSMKKKIVSLKKEQASKVLGGSRAKLKTCTCTNDNSFEMMVR